jgi:two-component system, NtrC family, response regulator HydG
LFNYPDETLEVFHRLPCGILILDEQKKIVFANARIEGLTGLSRTDLIGSNMCSVGLGSDQEKHLISGDEWWEWAEGTALHFRTSIKDAQGTMVPVFINGRRSRDEKGVCSLYLCILDLTHLEEWSIRKETSGTDTVRERFYGLIGKSAPMQELYRLIEMASGTGVNVVIQGESGTGKELVAAAIHNASGRSARPFVRVNCAALAETLLESELFGHVKGSFTGAIKDRMGTFEAAHEGTILLDEIGEISPAVQVKLLRVLQERVIVRVGDNKEIPVDVRIIAATNRNLRSMVQEGTFREDLFYRLNVFMLHLPALYDRMADIPLLCSYFIRKFREATGRNILSVSPEAMRLFMNYCWPGNVRELENTIEHAFVVCQTEEILVKDLPHELRVTAVREGICAKKAADIRLPRFFGEETAPTPRKSNGRLNITEKQLVAELEKHGGNKSATARSLGISKVALWKKMKKLGMTQ